jgi:hypothetical protein
VSSSRQLPGTFALTLILAGLAAAIFPSLHAEDHPGGPQALEGLFQLGLPDTRGAKWVTAYVGGWPQQPMLPNASGDRMGNAWLLREEPGGTVELVVDQSRRLRARRREGDDGTKKSTALPIAHIQPADLEKDMATLAAAVAKNGAPGGREYSEYDYRQARALQGVGQALLFLAHLQRQGRGEFVGRTLPGVLALAPAPEQAVDAAVSALASGRLAQLTDEWIARGDAQAFANGVEALAAQFSRGWKQRDAALLLAQRARTPVPSPHTGDPAAQKTAAFLFGLRPGELDQPAQRGNWLLPSIPGVKSEAGDAEAPDPAPTSADVAPSSDSTVHDPLAPLLAGKRTAAAALARLLDDHRLLRVRRDTERSYSSYRGGTSREDLVKQSYDELPRPSELGDLAAALLEPILPDTLRGISDGSRTARILAWLKDIEALSDDQLAWDYLRRARSTYEDDFRTSLDWLVQRGSGETVEQLREVFLDPAVWQGGSRDELLPLLPQYLKRLPGDTAPFREKLRVAFTKALDEERRENIPGLEGNEAMKKAEAGRAAGELKKFDQVLKPRGLGELLAEIADSGEVEEAEGLFQPAAQMLAKAPRGEAEAQLFQAAARAKLPAVKQRLLLMLTMQTNMQNLAAGKAAREAAPEVPGDAATRAALQALLDDETPGPDDEFGMGASRTVAESTAMALVWPRLPPHESAAWTELFQALPALGTTTLKQHARALATGQPPPARPDASRVPPPEVQKLAANLAVRPAGEVFAALRACTPDQQLALARHFAALPQWPPALIAAALTINDVRSGAGEPIVGFAAEPWKGRRFDETVRAELTAELEKLAREGRSVRATLSAAGPWSGLTLSVVPNDQTFEPEQIAQSGFPGLAGKPPVIAAVTLYLLSGDQQGDGIPVGYGFPIWKDAALTQAWRAEHLKPAKDKKTAGPASAEAADEEGQRNDPAPLETRLKAILAQTPEARGPFNLLWIVSIAAKTPNPSAQCSVLSAQSRRTFRD